MKSPFVFYFSEPRRLETELRRGYKKDIYINTPVGPMPPVKPLLPLDPASITACDKHRVNDSHPQKGTHLRYKDAPIMQGRESWSKLHAYCMQLSMHDGIMGVGVNCHLELL